MVKIRFAILWLLPALLFALPVPALADGIIVPAPPICLNCPPLPISIAQLDIRYHKVEVEIQDQIAVTRVDQVFFNPNDWQVEGTYIFPLPAGAVVTEFVLWIDGEPVQGEVLNAEQARQIYEDIVRSLQDPALLEYAGQGAVRARIFPIPPGGERRIELEYSQVLAAENGLVRYVYPLNTEKFSAQPLESVVINVSVRSAVPVRAIYSPSHPVSVNRQDEYRFSAGYEAQNVLPDSDFALYYSLGEDEAFHLLSYRDPGDSQDPDGFFLLLMAPRPAVDVPVLPKDVILVLDTSGSMDGEKFQQAMEALRYILRNLKPEDRFNVIAFSSGVEIYGRGMRPASEANEALAWSARLSAQGSTDINRALLEAAALADRERPVYLIFMTDGLPTQGVTNSQQILTNFARETPRNLRLFAFGVGYDVDTYLLDSLAQAQHGTSTYVRPGEALDEILSGFYAKISTPVLTDLQLDFGGLSVYDLYPSPLPDLFLGSQIILAGRYRDGGVTQITLRGRTGDREEVFVFDQQVFVQSSTGDAGALTSLPRLWATRKIGYLLNRVRLEGPDQETIDQIVRLSIRYGIVTPYTSYLVTEPMPLGAAGQERIAQEQFMQLQSAPEAPSFGQAAVERAADQADLAKAEGAYSTAQDNTGVVKIVGARTFILQEGVWIDTGYDPDLMQPRRVAFLSDDYFTLSRARPEIAAALALGQRVILVADGVAYEIVSNGEQVPPVVIPEAVTQMPGFVQPTDTPEPALIQFPERPSPGGLPCAGGLLPLLLLGLVGVLPRKQG